MFSGFLFSGCTPSLQACNSCNAPERASGIIAGGRNGAAPDGSPSHGLATLHCESQVPCVPPRSVFNGAPRLTVPSIFSRFQFSVIYTQLGATQGTLMDQQRSMLQAILKHFTKELSHGCVVLCVLDGDGRPTEYACSLDKGMTQLMMRPAGHVAVASSSGVPVGAGSMDHGTKALVFREIERICSPEEVRNIRASNLLFLDECCTTVVLTEQRFVTFRLDSQAAREYLMLCLQVLRMSQEKARMWYP